MLDEQFNEIYLGSNIFIRNVEPCEYLPFCLLVLLSLYISLFFLVSCLLALCTCALVSSWKMRFCLTSCSCLQTLAERKGLTVTSTSRHVNQSKNYIDDLQAGVLRTEVEEPSIGEKLLLAGLELCDKVGEERVTLAARW